MSIDDDQKGLEIIETIVCNTNDHIIKCTNQGNES
jgi:hypothetical protein